MLYPAFRQIDPPTAETMYQQKLLKAYQNGIWDNTNAYYVQNLAWLGLFPFKSVPSTWFEPTAPVATRN